MIYFWNRYYDVDGDGKISLDELNSKFGYNDLFGCRFLQGDTVTSKI